MLTDDSSPQVPFLKWPGGKRWAANLIVTLVEEYLAPDGTYFEPFLGGGAVFFHLQPDSAVLSDINLDLIQTYCTVRDRHMSVLAILKRMKISKKNYDRTRRSNPKRSIPRAARFLYLNRTAFGGIYRLNRFGEFNVPFGGDKRTPNILWKRELLRSAAQQLQGVDLVSCDFGTAISMAKKGDVIYCDPTYTVAHNNNCFVRYNEKNFSWADQERLVELSEQAVERGATVIVSNAYHSEIRDLYKKWYAFKLKRTSRVTPVAGKRNEVFEYLFLLRPKSLKKTKE